MAFGGWKRGWQKRTHLSKGVVLGGTGAFEGFLKSVSEQWALDAEGNEVAEYYGNIVGGKETETHL